MRRPRAAALLLALLIATFAAGIMELIQLRYGSGDVYAPYSSFRADPLGVKALHDSLAELPGLRVSRNLKPLARFQAEPGTAFLTIGMSIDALDELLNLESPVLRDLAVSGARVIVSMTPTNDLEYESVYPDMSTPASPGASPLSSKSMEERQRRMNAARSRQANAGSSTSGTQGSALGVELVYRHLPEHTDTGVQARDVVSALDDLQTTVPWHSAMGFSVVHPAWRPVLSRDWTPVAVEREIGRGSIVLMTDSYLFSNEALVLDRRAELLAWLLGDSSHVVFDETHHGLHEQPGVAALARQYRLHGFAVGVIVLFGLFIWRASSSLIPRRMAAPPQAAVLSGRDAASGLVHLLRRSASPGELLEACMQEWTRSRTTPPATPAEAQRLANVLEVAEEERERNPSRRDPVGAYRRISRILNERK